MKPRSSIPFQQHEPDRCLSTARRHRKCHRLMVRNSQAPRVIEPADEFRNRIVTAQRHDSNHAMRAISTAINP
jgi:hypothetical protein